MSYRIEYDSYVDNSKEKCDYCGEYEHIDDIVKLGTGVKLCQICHSQPMN